MNAQLKLERGKTYTGRELMSSGMKFSKSFIRIRLIMASGIGQD